MAWTAPITWTTNQVVTAANLNQQIRDNMLMTAPAKATGAGFIVSTGANVIAERLPGVNEIATSQTTASATFTNLATTGPTVTITTGNAAIVLISSTMSVDAAGGVALAGVAVTGASAISASDAQALWYESSAAGDMIRASIAFIQTGLTAGSNIFTMKYRVTSNTATFVNRALSIIPFG